MTKVAWGRETTITQLRSAGFPKSIALLAQGDELEGSLTEAYDQAVTWLATAGGQPPQERQP